MKLTILTAICIFIGCFFSGMAFADVGKCFVEASQRYQVPVELLQAISDVESGGNPTIVHRNSNGTTDIGHMQINSSWLPSLQKFGITAQSLMNACTNTFVGAWVLAQNFSRMGYGWEAVGAYNARNPLKAAIYSRRVARRIAAQTIKVGN